jgi:hypothetical protein
MDETKPDNIEETNEEVVEEEELSHTDKLVGVFTEPSNTYEETAKFPPRTMDWLIPTILVIVFAVASNYLMMSNPVIKQQIVDKQMEVVEKNLREAVDSGRMTEEQAEQQLGAIQERMEEQMSAGMLIQVVGTVIAIFVFFFLLALVYFILSKFILKGDGNYASSMVSYGLAQYIALIQFIVIVVWAFAAGKYIEGTSLATLMDSDTKTFAGYMLSKVDPLRIWFYAILSIGLAKMFKSPSTGKYFIGVFGLWIAFSIIIYFVAQAVPFLQFFLR